MEIEVTGYDADVLEIVPDESGGIDIFLSSSIPWGDTWANDEIGTRYGFKEDLKKALPGLCRWNSAIRAWSVSQQGIDKAVELLEKHFDVEITVIGASETPEETEKKFRVLYLGLPKERIVNGVKDNFAFAHLTDDLDASIAFSVEVLEDWFGASPVVTKGDSEVIDWQNPYVVLGVHGTIKEWREMSITELKRYYRKAAKTYHPDINREPGATQKFQEINEAWNEVLNIPEKRRLLDAALFFQEKANGRTKKPKYANFMPPVRCGLVTVTGITVMGQFIANKILAWDDITDRTGRVLVTYWDNGIREEWIDV